MSRPYFSQATNAHVLGVSARAYLLERLIARCVSGWFSRCKEAR